MLIVVSYLVYYENSLQNVTILLQNETAILLQNVTKFFYKMSHFFYYKMRHLLKHVSVQPCLDFSVCLIMSTNQTMRSCLTI